MMNHWTSPKAVCPLLLMALAAVADRSTVSLDFGWRVKTAKNAKCDYTSPFSGYLQGTGWPVTNITSADACMAQACKAGTLAYSFCPGPTPKDCGTADWDDYWNKRMGEPPHCIIGSTGQVSPDYKNGWTSMERSIFLDPSSPETSPGYDDKDWKVVDIPHDASIELDYTENADGGEAFIPAVQTFYRKHFKLQDSWRGKAITLEVDGALMSSSFYVNGVCIQKYKADGYLPLTVRLDTVAGLNLNYGDDDNILVVWTDDSSSTGWWYEGSGLARHARLVVAPASAQILPFGVAAPARVTGSVSARNHASEGLTAAAAIDVTADVSVSVKTAFTVRFDLVDTSNKGAIVGSTSKTSQCSDPGMTTTIQPPPLEVQDAELWSVARPYLYTLVATITTATTTQSDTVNTTVGIRELEWNAVNGLHVNGQPVKMRGFCNHESFAGVGAAIPPRIDLMRVQQMRGVGGNAWRTSHNPPEPALLDVTDRLGILVLDENRVLATTDNCPGDLSDANHTCARGYVPVYNGSVPHDNGKLALRDRTHASVAWWSLCNEMGCGPGTLLEGTVNESRKMILAVDKSRAITGNLAWQSQYAVAPHNEMSELLDVMGMSHQKSQIADTWHAGEPDKLVVMTECCSCETQRGEDADLLSSRNSSYIYFSNENSVCVANQTQVSNGPDWIGGTFVWTLHDYFGEPGNWPHISSSFGSFDLAGFPKAPVWWYRSWWLADIPDGDPSRPPLNASQTAHFCRLVESWQPSSAGSTRSLTVYTNAPFARILVNGDKVTDVVPVLAYGSARFPGIKYVAGKVTAECVDKAGGVLASNVKSSWGKPTSLKLSLDAPSIRTGTGQKLYLDGADVALVRATVVDENGMIVEDSTVNITFDVTSGPGRLVGVGNGDPGDHDPNHVNWKTTYHGLARAIVRVTIDASGDEATRSITSFVNPDAGSGDWSSSFFDKSSDIPNAIIISANAPGLSSATLDIPLSTNPIDSPLAAAAASIKLADIGE